MAVQYWKQARPEAGSKHSFVHLKLAYHGDTIGAVSVGNIELFHARFKPLLFPTRAVEPPYCYRCPLNMTFPECRLACLDPVEQVLRDHRQELAGLIIEPLMQAAAGMITQPPGYLKRIRELCTKYEVLLIADEVATGFGRTGTMFRYTALGLRPDLVAIGKALGAGIPVGAALVSDAIAQRLAAVRPLPPEHPDAPLAAFTVPGVADATACTAACLSPIIPQARASP